MFKNSVFKPSVNTIAWLKATAVRTVRSMAFTALSIIPTTGATMGAVDWKLVISASAVSGIITILTCVTGIPEVTSTDDTGE